MILIDSNALRRAICEFVHEKDDCVPCPNQITSCLWSKVRVCDFNRIINNQPTIDAEPVKHGHWIKENKVYPELPNDGDYYWYCSECGSQDQHNINVEVPFCWHCGAKMDK